MGRVGTSRSARTGAPSVVVVVGAVVVVVVGAVVVVVGHVLVLWQFGGLGAAPLSDDTLPATMSSRAVNPTATR